MLLQLATTLQPCELPLGLTVANLDQETPHLITFPAMHHLLRMWQVTPCCPQPQETWTHTGLCLLSKCFNHKHSTKTGATTPPHPGATAGMACEKRTRWLAVLEWVTQVPKFWKWLQSACLLSPWQTIQDDPQENISVPESDRVSDESCSSAFPSWLSYGLWCCVSSLPDSKLPVCSTGKISGSVKAVNSTLISRTFKIRGYQCVVSSCLYHFSS